VRQEHGAHPGGETDSRLGRQPAVRSASGINPQTVNVFPDRLRRHVECREVFENRATVEMRQGGGAVYRSPSPACSSGRCPSLFPWSFVRLFCKRPVDTVLTDQAARRFAMRS
jgi:hypothetical protein